MLINLGFLLVVIAFTHVYAGIFPPPGPPDVCPQIDCPLKIRPNCRKAEFVIGLDGRTSCRVCDSDLCGKPSVNCPQIQCPGNRKIRDVCRKAEFVMGLDGISRCRVCDSNLCGRRFDVCPQLECPNNRRIRRRCRVKQFSIGSDGITRCRMCDKNGCRPGASPPVVY